MVSATNTVVYSNLGIFGFVTGISATIIVMFILFGQFLLASLSLLLMFLLFGPSLSLLLPQIPDLSLFENFTQTMHTSKHILTSGE